MKYVPATTIILVALLFAHARAQEKVKEARVDSKMESIGLFKNGLAIVRRSVDLDGAGPFRIDNIPAPVHGTFWISGPATVSAMLTMRETDTPPRAGDGVDFQQQLVGKQVTIHFRDGAIPPASGRVVQVARAEGNQAWNRTYQQPEYNYFQGRTVPSQGQFLILDGPDGRIYADISQIAHLMVDDKSVKRRVPVLLLTAENAGEEKKNPPAHVTITYLTKGIAWAPAYRVILDDPKTLTLQQQAVIKNEMEDFSDSEIQLISGFPSIQFAHVTSPMSLETGWANFFSQLNQAPSQERGLMSNAMQSQQLSNRAVSDPSVDLSAIPSGEGVDLHYQSIGKRSMNEGDSLLLNTGQGQAAYERIVEWTVPDTRDADGRPSRSRNGSDELETSEDPVWDAVRFKNPLSFPITTAPALVTTGGQFNGQRQSFWVNTGEQTTLQITKALSVRTRSTEEEDQLARRDVLNIGSREYRKVTVKGELTASNHRKEPITLIIRRNFSGDLLKADGNPSVKLSEQGVYSINKRNVLSWSLTLGPGESKALAYQYSVLVAH